MSLLEKLKLGSKNTKLIDWPGTNEKVRMRIANEYDMSVATVEADRFFKERTIGTPNLQAYLDYKIAYRLYLMLEDPATNNKPIAPTFNEFYPLLTEDIKDDLESERIVFQEECSPDPELLTDSQIDAQLKELKKNFDLVIRDICNINIERQLLKCLVSRLPTSQQDN